MSSDESVEVSKDQSSERSNRSRDYIGEMDSMLDDFRRRFESTLYPFIDPWVTAGRATLGMPHVRHAYADVIDAGDEYHVMAEVPGIPKEKLDVRVTNREIRIEGDSAHDTDEQKEGYVRRERSYSKVQTNLTFPEEVVPNTAEASLNNGILEVKVAKKTPTQVNTLKVIVK